MLHYFKLRAVLIQPMHSLYLSLSLSLIQTQTTVQTFPPVPATFIATSSAGLFKGSLPWLLRFLNSPLSFPPFMGCFSLIFQLNVYKFITLKVSSSSAILIHPHLKSHGSHFGIFALLGPYAALDGSLLPTFRDNLSVPYSRVKQLFFLDCLILKNWADMLSQNVGNKLLICAE